MTDSLVILVPVLNRPEKVVGLIQNIESATASNHRLLFVASEGDDAEIAALVAAGADFIIVPVDQGTWALKVNEGFRQTSEQWVFAGADDLRFHPQWFERALRWANESTGVIGTNDICNPRVMTGEHSTHTLFRRDYVEKFGTIDQPGLVFHPQYGHAFCDDEAIATAKARGIYVHAFDSIVEHLHPNTGKSEDDATYQLGRKFTPQGRQLFRQRSRLWADEGRVRAMMKPPPERCVVVTASYGGYDPNLRPPVAQDIPTRWLCFTDDSSLVVPPPWELIIAESRWPDDSRMSAKVPKMTPDVDCPDVIWMDASHEIISPSFAREALACRRSGIAAFKHPRRVCAYKEIDALLGPEKQGGLYFDRPLREQAREYQRQRYPRNYGLYACGVLAWDLREDKAREFGRTWLDETEKWSHQDQIEFPVVARRLGIRPGMFTVDQIDKQLSRGHRYYENRWLRIHPHDKPVHA